MGWSGVYGISYKSWISSVVNSRPGVPEMLVFKSWKMVKILMNTHANKRTLSQIWQNDITIFVVCICTL